MVWMSIPAYDSHIIPRKHLCLTARVLAYMLTGPSGNGVDLLALRTLTYHVP